MRMPDRVHLRRRRQRRARQLRRQHTARRRRLSRIITVSIRRRIKHRQQLAAAVRTLRLADTKLVEHLIIVVKLPSLPVQNTETHHPGRSIEIPTDAMPRPVRIRSQINPEKRTARALRQKLQTLPPRHQPCPSSPPDTTPAPQPENQGSPHPLHTLTPEHQPPNAVI